MKLITFNSMEEMFAFLAQKAMSADEAVDPNIELEPGDYFVRVAGDVIIYGEVLDPGLPVEPGNYTQQELFEIQEEGKVYQQPNMKHYRFTRCYSPLCADGELGDVHLSTVMQVLSKDQFELAKKNQWPQDAASVRALLRITGPGIA